MVPDYPGRRADREMAPVLRRITSRPCAAPAPRGRSRTSEQFGGDGDGDRARVLAPDGDALRADRTVDACERVGRSRRARRVAARTALRFDCEPISPM